MCSIQRAGNQSGDNYLWVSDNEKNRDRLSRNAMAISKG